MGLKGYLFEVREDEKKRILELHRDAINSHRINETDDNKSEILDDNVIDDSEIENLQLYKTDDIKKMKLPKTGGVYFWWIDSEAAEYVNSLSPNVKIDTCRVRNINGETYYLVYVGLASNLRNRVRNSHILQKHTNSTVERGFLSTLRNTIASVLGKNLYDEKAVNDFQRDHMLVGFIETDDYANTEIKYIESCSLPLNSKDNKKHPFNKELGNLRRVAKQRGLN
jgi:hypothetical protein